MGVSGVFPFLTFNPIVGRSSEFGTDCYNCSIVRFCVRTVQQASIVTQSRETARGLCYVLMMSQPEQHKKVESSQNHSFFASLLAERRKQTFKGTALPPQATQRNAMQHNATQQNNKRGSK